MSRIEHEARALLLRRRESIFRGPPFFTVADPSASWNDWETQGVKLAEVQRRELADIEAALRRIDEGRYGRCEACGGPLGLQRMRAVPEARFCMACSGHRDEPD